VIDTRGRSVGRIAAGLVWRGRDVCARQAASSSSSRSRRKYSLPQLSRNFRQDPSCRPSAISGWMPEPSASVGQAPFDTHAKARRLHFTKLRSTHPQHVISGSFKAASAVARPLSKIDATKCRRPPHLATSITSRPGRSHDRGHPDLVLLLARQVRREHLCSIAASRVNSPALELSIGSPKRS
jgi:hypothetical protein